MSDYTPTTEQVLEWVSWVSVGKYTDIGETWFDRWLRQVKAEALEEAGRKAANDLELNETDRIRVSTWCTTQAHIHRETNDD